MSEATMFHDALCYSFLYLSNWIMKSVPSILTGHRNAYITHDMETWKFPLNCLWASQPLYKCCALWLVTLDCTLQSFNQDVCIFHTNGYCIIANCARPWVYVVSSCQYAFKYGSSKLASFLIGKQRVIL